MDKVIIAGRTFHKNLVDICNYVSVYGLPDGECVEDMTINEIWETMKQHEEDEEGED